MNLHLAPTAVMNISCFRKVFLFGIRFAFTSILLSVSVSMAMADNFNKPMQFSIGHGPYGKTLIFADGDYEDDTAIRFKDFLRAHKIKPGAVVVLNSQGGAVTAGIDMGYAIRRWKLSTSVGSETPLNMSAIKLIYRVSGLTISREFPLGNVTPPLYDPDGLTRQDRGYGPGYCLSSCSLAFLGGVSRDVPSQSVYGMHEIHLICDQTAGSSLSPEMKKLCTKSDAAYTAGEIGAAEMVDYFKSLGIDPSVLLEMAKATPYQMNIVSRSDLEKYGIVYYKDQERWALEASQQGDIFLQFSATLQAGTEYARFRCANGGATMSVDDDWGATNIGGRPQDAVAAARRGMTLIWARNETKAHADGNGKMAISPADIIAAPALRPHDVITLRIRLSPQSEKTILAADDVSFMTAPSAALKGFSYHLAGFSVDHQKLAGFLASCRRRSKAAAPVVHLTPPRLLPLVTKEGGLSALMQRYQEDPRQVTGYVAGFSLALNRVCPFLDAATAPAVAALVKDPHGRLDSSARAAGQHDLDRLAKGQGACFDYDLIVAEGTLREFWSHWNRDAKSTP